MSLKTEFNDPKNYYGIQSKRFFPQSVNSTIVTKKKVKMDFCRKFRGRSNGNNGFSKTASFTAYIYNWKHWII